MKDHDLLLSFIETLKQDGFKCYASEKQENFTYCFFVKDNNIGYVQEAYFGGLSFSTVHKPCREFGTGFGFSSNEQGVYEPTLKNAYDSFIIAPQWVRDSIKAIVKYKSWDEYTKRETVLKYIEV